MRLDADEAGGGRGEAGGDVDGELYLTRIRWSRMRGKKMIQPEG